MKDEIRTKLNSPEVVAVLSKALTEAYNRLLEEGVHPHRVAEAAIMASLPLLIEVTRAPTIEACLSGLAARFDGNTLRRTH